MLPVGGGTVTTDTEFDGATPSDPVETTVTSPNGGAIFIREEEPTQPIPGGFEIVGQQVQIVAPPADPADPLVIVFEIDLAVVPAGSDATDVELFKDDLAVQPCVDASGTADPDPCILDRGMSGEGDIQIIVLTSVASVWSFGVPAGPSLDVDANGVVDVATDIVYVARRLSGLSPVPASFRDLDPTIPSDEEIAARVDALGSSLDVDGNDTVDVATDVVYIARYLLGLPPVPQSFRDLDPTIPPDSEIISGIEAIA